MPKNRSQKSELLAEYKDVVAKGNFLVLATDKVPAAVITDLRKLLASVDAKLYVIKNTVFAKAAVEADEKLGLQEFVGQLAVIEGGKDIVIAAKQLEQSTKEARAVLALTGADDKTVAAYSPFAYKFGYISGSILNDKDVVRLSKLPDRQTVIAQFVGTLAAPLSSFMNVLNGVPRAFVYALTDLQNKKAE